MEILYLAAGILGLLIGGYILFVFPIQFNSYFENRYGTNACSWALSVLNCVFVVATWYEGTASDKFTLLLTITIVLIVVSLIYCICKAIKAKASAIDTIGAVAAQIVSSVAIIVALILLVLLSDRRKKRRKRRYF